LLSWCKSVKQFGGNVNLPIYFLLTLNETAIKASVLDGLRDVDIDPVHERAGDPPLVLPDLLGRAAAGAAPVAEVAAGALIRSPFLTFF
jgi:hypothetical protein